MSYFFFKRATTNKTHLKRAFKTINNGLDDLKAAIDEAQPPQKCEKAELPRGGNDSRDPQRADKVKTLNKVLRTSRDMATPSAAQNGKISFVID